MRKVKSAVRTVELLEYLAARHDNPARLREISEALDMPRSSAHALLRTLVARAGCGPTRTGTLYGIGIRALLVGTSYLDSDPYLPLITPFLDELRQDLDETFHLGRLDGTDIVYLATRESKQYNRDIEPGRPAAARICHSAGQGAAGRAVRRRARRARPGGAEAVDRRRRSSTAARPGRSPRRRAGARLRHRRRGEHRRVAVFRRRRCATAARRRTPSAHRYPSSD